MSLFRELITAAINCDLSKNEYKAFLGLLHQTLGFGKASDPISNNRLVSITKVRKDRLSPALDRVVDYGLFDCVEHDRFDFEYTLGSDFLKNHFLKNNTAAFFAPSFLENRNDFRKTENISESRVGKGNTSLDLTSINPTQQQSVGAVFEPRQPSPAEPEQIETESVCGGDFELPKEIKQTDQATCKKILSKLTPAQRFNTIEVFCAKHAQGGIRSTPAYLSSLAKSAQNGTLTPLETIDTTTPLHASHIPVGQQHTTEKEEQHDRGSQLAYLNQQVDLYGEDVAHWAKLLGMQNVLEETNHARD